MTVTLTLTSKDFYFFEGVKISDEETTLPLISSCC